MTHSNYWRKAIFLSLIIHLAAGLCLSFAVPKFFTEKVLPVEEDFIDVDLTNLESFVEESPDIEISEDEPIPEFEFPEIVMPEFKIPETVFETPKFTPPEIKPVEITKTPVVETPPPVQPKIETETPPPVKPEPEKTESKTPKIEKAVEENVLQKLNRPAVIVNEVYPKKGSGLGYTGKIILNVKIDKSGRVVDADIVQGSGRMFVDSLAQEYITKWNFRPALDEKGRPMESSKVIQFDFKKFS